MAARGAAGPGGRETSDAFYLARSLDLPQGMAEAEDLEDELGAEGNRALIAAREHLATVSEELASIQRQFDANCAGFALPGTGLHSAAREGDSLDARTLEGRLRHLEVDLDKANMRAERLAREKEELLAVQADLEAELRATRRSLDETKRLLRHRELDLQQYLGHPPLDMRSVDVRPMEEQQPVIVVDLTIRQDSKSDSKSETPSLASATPSPIARTKDSMRLATPMTKPQLVASWRATQAELREEQGRFEKLDRRTRKDRERMDNLTALADRQRGEIGLLRRRGDLFEAYAGECERKLRQSLAQLEGAGGAAAVGSEQLGGAGAWGAEAAQPLSPVGGSGGGALLKPGFAVSPSMARQRSAPTRLPNVLRCRA